MPSGRRRHPRDTAARDRIITSATGRLLRDGYLATTMATVAEDAGVSVQTVYCSSGSKVGLLATAHDVALAGDDEPVPLLERPWARELVGLPSAGSPSSSPEP